MQAPAKQRVEPSPGAYRAWGRAAELPHCRVRRWGFMDPLAMDTPPSALDSRAVLRRVGGGLALLVLAPAAKALEGCCRKALSCADTAGLSFADVQTRVTVEYADQAVDPSKHCRTCQHFRSAGEAACGRCEIVKGSINPSGGCRSWVLKT